MNTITLTPEILTPENFAPYGDVICLRDDTELSGISQISDNAQTAVKVIKAECVQMPTDISFFERHPLSTQCFIPMNGGQFFVVVSQATDYDSFDLNTLKCFITDGNQGIKYNIGVWHSPFRALDENKIFTVIDRQPNDGDAKNINISFAKFPDTTITIK